MSKYIFTFGSNQLPNFRANPMKVMLVIKADNESIAKNIVFDSPIGNKFCTSYPYDEYAQDFKDNYSMDEWTLKDLLNAM